MARLSARIFLIIMLSLAVTSAARAEFSVKRSISMDQWVTWPDPSRWNDADVLDNFPEWRSFVSREELDRLKAAGFDTVRLPIDPAVFLLEADPIRQARLHAGVQVAIGRLRDAGLKVIVDMHTIPRDEGPALGTNQILDEPSNLAAYLFLIGDIASQLRATDPDHVALELMNEPSDGCSTPQEKESWHKKLEHMHKAARAANASITLVLTGACGGSAEGLAAVDPAIIADDNVLWTFHHYGPFMLTHQSAGWAGHRTQALSRIPYPPTGLDDAQASRLVDENDARIDENLSGMEAKQAKGFIRDHLGRLRQPALLRDEMRQPFEIVDEWAKRHGVDPGRIFLGEFGMIRQEYAKDPATDASWRIDYMSDMAELAEEHGFAWSVWSFGGAFGVVQGFGGEPAEAELLARFPAINPT